MEYLPDSIKNFWCSNYRKPETKVKTLEQELKKFGNACFCSNYAKLLRKWKKTNAHLVAQTKLEIINKQPGTEAKPLGAEAPSPLIQKEITIDLDEHFTKKESRQESLQQALIIKQLQEENAHLQQQVKELQEQVQQIVQIVQVNPHNLPSKSD